jgi:diaminopimelate epimerase
MKFSKYEGLGNDFLLVDAAEMTLDALTPDRARALCDRHRGVGGDGVLWVDTVGLAETGHVRMVIRNADGSRPEMCGNGVRCVAAWLRDTGRVEDRVVIDSDAGPRAATIAPAEHGAWRVEVEMGPARVAPSPATARVDGDAVDVAVVDVGNPHGVVFDPAGDAMALVAGVRGLAAFPQGVNVELVTARSEGGFRVRVYERGVGWTQACGTGACAVAAAAVAQGRAAAGVAVPVELDGGVLEIVVPADAAPVRMTGPARRVFVGTV